MGSFFIACDLGSSQCKVGLFNEEGTPLCTVSGEYPTRYPRSGWAEQDPEDWYQVCTRLIREAVSKAGIPPQQVAGLGIVGVSHNAVLLDSKGEVLQPSILIYDTRSIEEVASIMDEWGEQELRKRTLNDLTTVWTWPQLLWVKHHRPEVWKKTAAILFQKDYVRNRLAPSLCTDYIDAHGSFLFDPISGSWIPEFCRSLDIGPSVLPETLSPTDVAGRLSREGARDTLLSEGIPVITGTTDTVAEVLGSGGVHPGIATLKLASVGRITLVSQKPLMRPHILNYRHVIDGLWYPGTASKSAAFSFRWLKDLLFPGLEGSAIYQQMDREAAGVPAGSGGVLFHPHIMGEWAPHWNNAMRANFIGLTSRHGRAHLIRAGLEGIAFSLKDAFDQMEIPGEDIREVKLIGQGAKSSLWSQIVADTFSRRVFVPSCMDAVFGAGLITIMGITGKTIESFSGQFAAGTWYEPHEPEVRVYEQMLAAYRDADASLMHIYERLSAIEKGAGI